MVRFKFVKIIHANSDNGQVIEIMGHDTTDPLHVTTMMEQTAAHGFSPYHVRTSSMGYIFNR